MSIIWGEALHRAYPYQEPHIRPSGIANCARQQVGLVSGIRTNHNHLNIWPAEMGRAGQAIAMKSLGSLPGITIIDEDFKIDGHTPGEGDAIIEVSDKNIFGLDSGKYLGECKVRSTYVYNHIWLPDEDGNLDLMEVEAGTGSQINLYMGQSGLRRTILLMLPQDSASVRNDFRRKYKGNDYIRIFIVDFNPQLYVIQCERIAELNQAVDMVKAGKMKPENVMPEYDPTEGKFPCTWASGQCNVYDWCHSAGPGGLIEIPELPKFGMIAQEIMIG